MSKEPEVMNLLSKHKGRADAEVLRGNSVLVRNAYADAWAAIGTGTIAQTTGQKINVDFQELISEVEGWGNEFSELMMRIRQSMSELDKDDFQERMRRMKAEQECMEMMQHYTALGIRLSDAETDFSNSVLYYRSPLRQALLDISILYSTLKEMKGRYTGFGEVSVYIHGIESNGNDFLESAKDVAEEGDVIVHKRRDGKEEYYVVTRNREGNLVRTKMDYPDFLAHKYFTDKKGRLHFIYDTEHKNEHRQETSDDLAAVLAEMGLFNDDVKMDFFGHSYGGRRSLQFAMDFPDRIRSITTIGTPYDTNMLANTAKKAPGNVAEWIGKYPRESSGYLDFNEDNKISADHLNFSNAYSDLAAEPMSDDIGHLRSNNPELYRKLLDMNITAVAGYSVNTYINPRTGEVVKKPKGSDDVVSVDSQNGVILEDLIDERIKVEVEGNSTISNPGHVNEINDEDFLKIIKEVNAD